MILLQIMNSDNLPIILLFSALIYFVALGLTISFAVNTSTKKKETKAIITLLALMAEKNGVEAERINQVLNNLPGMEVITSTDSTPL